MHRHLRFVFVLLFHIENPSSIANTYANNTKANTSAKVCYNRDIMLSTCEELTSMCLAFTGALSPSHGLHQPTEHTANDAQSCFSAVGGDVSMWSGCLVQEHLQACNVRSNADVCVLL